MNKTGNGDKGQCVSNLLKITRGEVHLDQLRGIRADLIDMPTTSAEPHLRANVFWMIEHYEPRVNSLDFTAEINESGDIAAASTIQ